jgi:hypothetical protein
MDKKFSDFPTMVGHLSIKKYNSEGKLVDSRFIPNLVVTAGKSFIASRMIGTSSAVMSHMELGTSSSAAVIGDTTLITPLAWSRTAFSGSPSVIANAVTYSADFAAGAGNSGAITEAGIFNAGSAGTMLCRTVFPVVNKADGDTISISWTVTVL